MATAGGSRLAMRRMSFLVYQHEDYLCPHAIPPRSLRCFRLPFISDPVDILRELHLPVDEAMLRAARIGLTNPKKTTIIVIPFHGPLLISRLNWGLQMKVASTDRPTREERDITSAKHQSIRAKIRSKVKPLSVRPSLFELCATTIRPLH
jgi:hypothetical protein